MLAYGCIGILFLFVAVKSILYWVRRKSTPSHADIDQTLLTILNGESGQS